MALGNPFGVWYGIFHPISLIYSSVLFCFFKVLFSKSVIVRTRGHVCFGICFSLFLFAGNALPKSTRQKRGLCMFVQIREFDGIEGGIINDA
ncbi:hypothetical protein CGRA01v4_04661 [Colletotrichum graminicola]|nr:hypothetical protein CGRA01v4_04661 [Colletotrichum graminicola]